MKIRWLRRWNWDGVNARQERGSISAAGISPPTNLHLLSMYPPRDLTPLFLLDLLGERSRDMDWRGGRSDTAYDLGYISPACYAADGIPRPPSATVFNQRCHLMNRNLKHPHTLTETRLTH